MWCCKIMVLDILNSILVLDFKNFDFGPRLSIFPFVGTPKTDPKSTKITLISKSKQSVKWHHFFIPA
jgi:hypothetical protein